MKIIYEHGNKIKYFLIYIFKKFYIRKEKLAIMLKKLGEKIFGTSDEREIKKMQKLVDKINEIEPLFEKMTDEQLSHKTVEFKERLEK